ncbi:unnamed protein product [Tilletia caries]|uniref:ATP-dependent DNA ligase family profile domain-containing protein n=1 Tax=Tilletia caries TaxID=13290 RepID=A0ABN7J8Q6_9BASI|nr:unnamed protein product [Tilletia caries]
MTLSKLRMSSAGSNMSSSSSSIASAQQRERGMAVSNGSTPKKRSAAGAGAAGSSPASKKQKKQQQQQQQQSSITSFFTSPSQHSRTSKSNNINTSATNKEDHSSAGWEQDGSEIDADERLARQLQAEWDAEATNATSSSASLPAAAASKSNTSPSSVASSSRIPSVKAEGSSSNALSLTDATQAAKLSKPGPSPLPLSNPVLNPASIDLNALDAAIEAIQLGEDIFTFDPYAVDTSPWPHTAPNTKQEPAGPAKPVTPYALLTHAFVLVSSTKSRITITTVLTNLLRVLRIHDPDAILPAVYLISNHIAPPYDGVELGLGGSVLHKAVQSVTGKSSRFLKNLWDRTGDAGDVAFEAKKDIKMLTKPAPITVAKLFATLHTIARLSGAGSQSAKLSHVTKLLVASRGEETRFLARTFIAHLRIQAVRTTMATSLARAFALVDTPHAPGSSKPTDDGLKLSQSAKARGKSKASDTVVSEHDGPSPYLIHPHERRGLLAHPTKTKDRQNERWIELTARMAKAERVVREVRARHPNFTSIVPALLNVGLSGLSESVPLRIGTPLSPMLASITRSLPNMFDKLGTRPFVSEYKYDGQRVQIHAVLLPKNADPNDLPQSATLDQALFATGSEEGDARLRPILVESGRGKWVKAGDDDDRQIYVRLFSRHLEDQTDKYPDVLELVPLLLARGKDRIAKSRIDSTEDLGEEVRSFIMDAEIVAIGTSSEELLPFQTLASRSRKDVQLKDVKVKVGIFAFDLMYLNGQPLLKTAFRQRRHLLKKYFPPLSPENPMIACFGHVKSCESMDPEEVTAFFEQARAAHCEGISESQHGSAMSTNTKGKSVPRLRKLNDVVGNDLQMEDVPDEEKATKAKKPRKGEADDVDVEIVGKGVNGRGKALLSTYEPDKRCESWLKVKGDYLDSQDTLDLVPIGGWHGMGRKANWWSPVLLALYDPETGVYQALCKCISGFTDAEYKRIKFESYAENTDDCQEATSTIPPFEVEYDSALTPAFWWRPKEVWEIRCADITLSPVYTAARGQNLGLDTPRGLSIRFPRFIKRREDKGVEQATTPAQLAGMFREQMARAPAAEDAAGDADGEVGEVADEEEEEEEDDIADEFEGEKDE